MPLSGERQETENSNFLVKSRFISVRPKSYMIGGGWGEGFLEKKRIQKTMTYKIRFKSV